MAVDAQAADLATDPPRDCHLCPRLLGYLQQLRQAEPQWFNGPVPSFGVRNSRLLIVGLAPGVKGANRTGRPFTGDFAGDLLYKTLAKFRLSNDSFQATPGDGLELFDTLITNAVRCVPPGNKPIGAEIKNCQTFLRATIHGAKRLRVIVALGRVAHDSILSALDTRKKDHPFKHGVVHSVGDYQLIDSFHCSRYNTNTGRLTPGMFEDVFATATRLLSAETSGHI